MKRGRAPVAAVLATAFAVPVACAASACSSRSAAETADANAGGGPAASDDGGASHDGSSATSDGASSDAADAPEAQGRPTSCPNAMPTTKNGHSAIDLERPAFVDTTDVTVTFCNPLMAAQPDDLVFLVVLTDHAGLLPSDATKPTWVVTDTGTREDKGFAWNGTDLTSGDHHAGGLLSVPAAISDGMGGQTPMLASTAQWLELHLDGIGSSGTDLSFRWTKEYLP